MKVPAFFLLKAIVLILAEYSNSHQILTSPLVTNWGTWGEWEKCPQGTKVISIQVLTERWYFWDIFFDNTCMNGIKLVCGDPKNGNISQMLTSKVGKWGKWGSIFRCNGDGFATGFMLRSEEENTAFLDETATNNLRIMCSGSPNGFMQLDGERWGQWTNPRLCDSTEYICGIQTQVQDPQGFFGDDTALNNIRVECCDLPQEDLVYYGITQNNRTV